MIDKNFAYIALLFSLPHGYLKLLTYLYKMKWIKNKYPKTRADKGYWLTWHNGEPAMFTEEQLQVALIRAKQNPEDTHCSWFQKILNKIL